MAVVEPSVLANSIMGKLYNILTNGDDTVPKSDDNFFSWCTPGTPMDVGDFEFLTQGLTGVVKKPAVDAMQPTAAAASGTAAAPAAAAADAGAAQRADGAGYHAACTCRPRTSARLLDFVPDVAASTNKQFAHMAVQNNDGTLSDIYDYTLRMSQVMKTELPAGDGRRRSRSSAGCLQKVVKKKDLITDEEVEVVEPSELQKAYFTKMAAYDDAALEYNARRIDALTASRLARHSRLGDQRQHLSQQGQSRDGRLGRQRLQGRLREDRRLHRTGFAPRHVAAQAAICRRPRKGQADQPDLRLRFLLHLPGARQFRDLERLDALRLLGRRLRKPLQFELQLVVVAAAAAAAGSSASASPHRIPSRPAIRNFTAPSTPATRRCRSRSRRSRSPGPGCAPRSSPATAGASTRTTS